MKFGATALLGLLLTASSSSDAFSINPHTRLVQQKLADVAAAAANNNNWRAPMNMVAGGAERAYGEDYYDGMLDSTTILEHD